MNVEDIFRALHRIVRFVLAGPSGFTRLSLLFLLRECGARMRRIFPVSPFFSCSNITGEREISAGTVTAPFSRLKYGQIGQMRYFEPPPLPLYRSPRGEAERRSPQSSCEITTGSSGMPRILFNGCVRSI